LSLKNSLVNPSPGIYLTGFAKQGSYLVNYSTSPGVVQVYGDYQLSGSTLTLDYSAQLYASSATTPVAMIGSSLSGMSVVLIDSNVVSQLVTMTYDGSAYQVVGSSTGNMGSFTATITNPTGASVTTSVDTAPSALTVIGMSPVVAGASRTVCGPPPDAFWDCALGAGAPLGQ